MKKTILVIALVLLTSTNAFAAYQPYHPNASDSSSFREQLAEQDRAMELREQESIHQQEMEDQLNTARNQEYETRRIADALEQQRQDNYFNNHQVN